MFKRYPQLQSGFLAPSEEMVVIPEAPPTTPAASLLNRVPTRSQQDLFYMPKVDEVVNEAIQSPLKLRDFGFQEKVLSVIGKAFANQNFWAFMKLQQENPGLSQVHIDFLAETVKVVIFGQERTVTLQTWASVISAANPSVGGFKAHQLAKEINSPLLQTMTLGDFVAEWIATKGYSDLLLSMQVLFGRRGLHGSQGGVNW